MTVRRIAFVLALLAAHAPAFAASRLAAIAAARAALPGAHAITATREMACNTSYWFVHLRRGPAHYLVLASAEGIVLRVVRAD